MREQREKPRRAALWLFKSSLSPVFKCYFQIQISTTGGKKEKERFSIRSSTTTGFCGCSGERKDESQRNVFTLRSFPFLRFVKGRNQQPPNATEFFLLSCCCLCLSGCVFSWLQSQVLVQRGEKKMKTYFV